MEGKNKEANRQIRVKPGIGYKIFKAYVRFLFSGMYNRRNYVMGRENIPEKGPVMIVSNHQNSLNDALALVMAVGERGSRKVRAVTRADAFRPVIGKIFRWAGLMPAYRMNYDGAETLEKNSYSFTEASEEIQNDGTVIIYPEAGHQTVRWLGTFTYGYLKILFDAAEATNFEKEIYLIPSCNHYEDYLEVQTDVLIRFGLPIALSPYYELYKTKPRTAQRQVNALVREKISGMMLNVTDLENYEVIDFLRETYGKVFAQRNGFDPKKLPEKIESDKILFEELNHLKLTGDEHVSAVYTDAAILVKKTSELSIPDECFDRKPSGIKLCLKGILLSTLFPLFLLALIPLILVIFAPAAVNRKIEDFMFHGTIRMILSVLFTVPITCIALLAVVWALSGSFLTGLISIVSLPILFIFAVYYHKIGKRFIKEVTFRRLDNKGVLEDLRLIRKRMYSILNEIVG